MSMRRVWSVVFVLAFAVSCGRSPTSPSSKTPNYAGAWSGAYTVTGCNQTGGVGAANVCGSIGASAPYTLTLSQSSTSVTGSFFLGSISFPSTGGTIEPGGSLSLQATSVSNGITVIVTWHLNMSGSALTGTISQIWTSNTLSGQANVAGTINSAAKS